MRKNRLLSKIRGKENCVVCGVLKVARRLDSGRFETPYNIMRRKTCGKGTDCYKEFMSGEGNPNYKGYMPKCIICGKRIGYNSAEDMRKGKIPKYCLNHAKESWQNGEYHELFVVKNRKQGLKMKGKVLEHLKPYLFKKGRVATNKLYDENSKCEVRNCEKKPIARNLCKQHYQAMRNNYI